MVVALVRSLCTRAAQEGIKEPPILSAADKQWLQNAWSASETFSMSSFLPDDQGN